MLKKLLLFCALALLPLQAHAYIMELRGNDQHETEPGIMTGCPGMCAQCLMRRCLEMQQRSVGVGNIEQRHVKRTCP